MLLWGSAMPVRRAIVSQSRRDGRGIRGGRWPSHVEALRQALGPRVRRRLGPTGAGAQTPPVVCGAVGGLVFPDGRERAAGEADAPATGLPRALSNAGGRLAGRGVPVVMAMEVDGGLGEAHRGAEGRPLKGKRRLLKRRELEGHLRLRTLCIGQPATPMIPAATGLLAAARAQLRLPNQKEGNEKREEPTWERACTKE